MLIQYFLKIQKSLIIGFIICFTHFSYADTALFYGADIPIEELSVFDNIVVLPESVDTKREATLFSLGSKAIAYVSIGEVAEKASYRKGIPDEWTIGLNKAWSSLIMDNASRLWHDYLLDVHIKSLVDSGFQGLFLDTLDSYKLTNLTPEKLAEQKAGLEQLIIAISDRYPDLYIIINRGFELMPAIASSIDEVLVESLFSAYDVSTNEYSFTHKADQDWLINKLNEIKSKYGKAITILDYLSESKFEESASLISAITKLGFSPWITNGHLTALGQGSIKPVPRKLLAFYYNEELDDQTSNLHIKLAASAEYLGYYFEYYNLAKKDIPSYPLVNRYAGIVSWITNSEFPKKADFCQFLLDARNNSHLKTSIINEIPNDPGCYQLMDIDIVYVEPQRLSIRKQNQKYIGTELDLIVRTKARSLVISKESSREDWLQLEGVDGTKYSAVFFDKFGGAALADFATTPGYDEEHFWVVEPMKFLRKSLSLAEIPVIDATTENGLQILTAHIDGDGIASINKEQRKVAGRVIFDEILTKYDIPTTVSIIEAETSKRGIYPGSSKKTEQVAREIFALDNVEIASHSYTHPFFWNAIDNPSFVKNGGYGTHLQIPGYSLSLEREIDGSVDYINQRLAPKGKSVKTFLWSGDARPDKVAIERVENLGLSHFNGANTSVFDYNFSMSRVWPVGLLKGAYYQIYAPVINENVYTNLWKGPYFGYQNVINTFESLSSPKRLKPISIYYHFYSGEKEAGVRALKAVYNYAIGQPLNAMHVSEFSNKAKGIYTSAIGLKNGAWLISNKHGLKTIRVHKTSGYPTLNAGVIGFKDHLDTRYIHLLDGKQLIEFQAEEPKLPFLSSFVGQVTSWVLENGVVKATLKSHVNGELIVGGLTGICNIRLGDKTFTSTPIENKLSLSVQKSMEIDFMVSCGIH